MHASSRTTAVFAWILAGCGTVAVVLAVSLNACSGSDPKSLTSDAERELNSGDSKAALKDFESALKKMDASNSDYLRAAIGRCQALAGVEATKAKDEFLALAKAQSTKIKDQDFSFMAYQLLHARALVDAVDVMRSGILMYPESPSMQLIKSQVVEESKKANNPEAMKKLKGFGYI